MVDQLQRLIKRIEDGLAALPPHGDYSSDQGSSWRLHQDALQAVVDGLVGDEGAKYRKGTSDAYSLNLAGIRTTCTSGNNGLLTGWCGRARKRIAEISGDAE